MKPASACTPGEAWRSAPRDEPDEFTRRGFLRLSVHAAGGLVLSNALAACVPPRPVVPRPGAWNALPDVLARIRPPTIPSRTLDITACGARSGTDSTRAIALAIAELAAAGGGRVVVPAGVFESGPITLRSGIELHLDRDATIAFSRNPDDYLPAVLTRWEGVELLNYQPMVYALDGSSIAITGRGVLDGRADEQHWWPWRGSRRHGWRAGTPTQGHARHRLFAMAEAGEPVGARRFGAGDCLRPSMVQAYRCRNVLVEGITIRNAPMWALHPVLSRNVTIRGVSIENPGPNGDGCNPESCRDVLIEGCTFHCGDDCIALKSGRNRDGRRLSAPSANIIIRNCDMYAGEGGVTIGSEISGGVHDVFVERCRMGMGRLRDGIRVKNNAARGGVVERVFVRDIDVHRATEAVVAVSFRYEEGSHGRFVPVVRDVELRRLRSWRSEYALMLLGLEDAPVTDVRVYDCEFDGVVRSNRIDDAERLQGNDVYINGVRAGMSG